MWWSDRRGALLLLGGFAALGPGGCGFRPLLAGDGPAARLAGRVEIGEIRRGPLPDRMTYAFHEALRRHFGRAATEPRWRLDVTLSVESRGLAITPDNATTRYNLTGRALWALRARDAAEPLLSGTAESWTAYSATATVYATRIAARDAERRLAVALADRIASEVAARAGDLPA